MIRYNINTCDHPAEGSELMVHFTKFCPHHCPFCIDKTNPGVNYKKKPNVDAIIKTINTYKDYVKNISISGGEPFAFIDELDKLITWIKENTSLKILIFTSIPENCFKDRERVLKILNKCDSIQISLQAYNEDTADRIRGVRSIGSKNAFYRDILEYCGEDKVVGSLNIIKPYFNSKEDIIAEVILFNHVIGFKNIKICEMFDADEYYIDIPKMLGIKLPSPFASGCKTEYKDAVSWSYLGIPFKGKLYIKRSCFYRTNHQKAKIVDLLKICTRWIFAKKYFFGVIHENGEIAPYWI